VDNSTAFVLTSQLFRAILNGAPSDHVTLAWLLQNLRRRSFGMVMLLLGLLAMIPGVCVLAAVVLGILGFQMTTGRDVPFLPRFIGDRRLPAKRIERLTDRVIPVMETLETFIRPRWHTPFTAMKRLVGLIVVLLALTIFMPIPLSNILPGALTMLVAFAYLEEDGMLLCIALIASVGSLAITGAEAWAAVRGADSLFRALRFVQVVWMVVGCSETLDCAFG
jgi:hypothetical protein